MSSRVLAGVRVRRDPQCRKRDPHLWSGRGALKHLLVGSMFSLLAKSLGKGQGGTETFVPLKPVPHMASQPVLGTHMGDLWSAVSKICRFIFVNVLYKSHFMKAYYRNGTRHDEHPWPYPVPGTPEHYYNGVYDTELGARAKDLGRVAVCCSRYDFGATAPLLSNGVFPRQC